MKWLYSGNAVWGVQGHPKRIPHPRFGPVFGSPKLLLTSCLAFFRHPKLLLTTCKLILHCDTARRADKYHFVVTHTGSGLKLAEKLSGEPEATIGDLIAGTTLNITASAKSSTGESQPCAPISAVVP